MLFEQSPRHIKRFGMIVDPDTPLARADVHSVFVVVPRFNLATLITMIETMRVGNYLSPDKPFSWETVCFEGPAVVASNGMTLATKSIPDTAMKPDFVFVLGSWGAEHREGKEVSAWLRRQSVEGATICAVELGCYLVARAGLLRDKTIATHWSWLNGFQERYDQINVVEDLYTIDNRIMSCAGGLAGVDLMLDLIATRYGDDFSNEIADQILYAPRRRGDAPQRGGISRSAESSQHVIGKAIALIEENVEEPLAVPDVAKAVGLSQRQLERQFKKSVGCTVVQYAQLHRLQHARGLLISTDMSVRDIAAASGFNSIAYFSTAFTSFFGRPPSKYRDSWPKEETAPSWPGTLSDYLKALKKKQAGRD